MSVPNTKPVQSTHVVFDRFTQDQLELWLAEGARIVSVTTYTDQGMNHSVRGPNGQTLSYPHRSGAFVIIERDITPQQAQERFEVVRENFRNSHQVR